MSNYIITTDFGAKDDLPSGNAAKVIKGSEFSAEFTNIKTAVNSKADLVSPTFTGNTALNGTTTFGPDGTSTFNGTVNFTKDVTFDTNTMFVDVSENRVGIGTTSPATALNIREATPALRLEDNQGGNKRLELSISNDAVGRIKANQSASELAFETTGTERMRIDSAGRLLIGGTQVQSPSSIDNGVFIQSQTNNEVVGVNLYTNEASNNRRADFFLDDANGIYGMHSTASTGLPDFVIKSASNERFRVTNSGNVGIGTSSPTSPLDIRGSVNGNLDLAVYNQFDDNDENAPNPSARLYLSAVSNNAYLEAHGAPENSAGLHKVDLGSLAATSFLTFSPSGSEKMRIDSSGNVLVGKTASSLNTTGIQLQNDGLIRATKSGADVLQLNRQSTDGAIVNFYKDGGTPIGSIGARASYLNVGSGDTGLLFNSGQDRIQPESTTGGARDAAIDLGGSSTRFKDIYRSGSTYSTSDRNKKQDIRDLTDAEARVAVVAKGSLKAFRYIDTVEAEGDDANIHFGIIAQDLKAAFEAEGLNADSYQVLKTSTYTDDDGLEQTTYSVCYENLLAFIISAI